jgi:hypothetical protein
VPYAGAITGTVISMNNSNASVAISSATSIAMPQISRTRIRAISGATPARKDIVKAKTEKRRNQLPSMSAPTVNLHLAFSSRSVVSNGCTCCVLSLLLAFTSPPTHLSPSHLRHLRERSTKPTGATFATAIKAKDYAAASKVAKLTAI